MSPLLGAFLVSFTPGTYVPGYIISPSGLKTAAEAAPTGVTVNSSIGFLDEGFVTRMHPASLAGAGDTCPTQTPKIQAEQTDFGGAGTEAIRLHRAPAGGAWSGPLSQDESAA